MNEQNNGLVPLIVWKFLIGIFLFISFLCFIAVLYYHHASLQDFLSSGLDVFFTLLKLSAAIVAGVLVVLIYRFYHRAHTEHYARKTAKSKYARQELQNRLLETQIEVMQQGAALVKYAIDSGHNVKIDKTGAIEVVSYLSNIHSINEIETPAAPLALPAPDFMPEPYKFSDVLANWQPSESGILLAKKEQAIIVPAGESLCHTTFTGNTDSGKTNNERLLLIQLLFLQQCVYLCDRNYQTFRQDKKTGAVYDYRPIEDGLAHAPIDTAKGTLSLLKYLVNTLDERRIERRKAIVRFQDIYLVMDELPAFASEEKDIMFYIGRLVREARQYGIFFIGAAQDLLNQTLNNDNGAIRENLLTNFYGGGDLTTARIVLNLARGEKIDETGLGNKGLVFLRAKGAGIERIKARTPLSDDAATHLLLPGYENVARASTAVLDRELNAAPYVESNQPAPAAYHMDELRPRQDAPEPSTEQGAASALTGDLRRVYDACLELKQNREKVSSRNVEVLTSINKDRANTLLWELHNMGFIERRTA